MGKMDVMDEHVDVLDKGFIRVVDVMGGDAAVVQGARVSYGAGTRTVNDDKALINYLMRNKHTSPFELAAIKLHVKAPLFVLAQWIRHRTASVNVRSYRYSEIPDEFYIPEKDRIRLQSEVNKQGSSEQRLDEDLADIFISDMQFRAKRDADKYDMWARKEKVSREIARADVGQNLYTEFYWMINLHNLMHFLQLRTSDHAQYEIRVYANAIADIMKEWVPLTWVAFKQYRLDSMTLTAYEIRALNNFMAQGNVAHYFPSEREEKEFKAKCRKLGIKLEKQEAIDYSC